MSSALYQKSFSALIMFLGVIGLSGCPTVTDMCDCNPELIPLPETTTDLVAYEIQDSLQQDGETASSSWPDDPESPFADILEMNATWEGGILTVDYTTEEGDFRAVFETERSL